MKSPSIHSYQVLLSAAVAAEGKKQFADADRLFERALSYAERQSAKVPNEILRMLLHFAEACAESGRLEKAEAYYLRAVVLLESLQGLNGLSAALIMRQLAELSERQGKVSEADCWSGKSLSIMDSFKKAAS